MLDSLFIATTGLNAQQTQIDVISNNIANVNTIGYKKSKVNFDDLIYKEMKINNMLGQGSSTGYVGTGVSASANEKVFTDGYLKKTNGALDLSINGNGFFEVVLPDGTNAYTRTGVFRLDENGFITDKDGNQLSTLIQIPSDYESLYISPDGVVSAKLPNETDVIEMGKIDIVSFVNTNSLLAKGNNLYVPTAESGDALAGMPGENGLGTLSQGYLESSNVEYVEELTDLVLAQRTYEMNSKMLQVSDQIMGIINNLYRS